MKLALLTLWAAASAAAQAIPHIVYDRLPHSGSPAIVKAETAYQQLLARSPRPLDLRFSEKELNEYAQAAAKLNAAYGIANPLVRILPGDRIYAAADVNLTLASQFTPGLARRTRRLRPLLPASMKRVEVTVSFQALHNVLTARVESARIGGAYVSPTLLNLGLRFVKNFKEGRLNVIGGLVMPWRVERVFVENGTLRLIAP